MEIGWKTIGSFCMTFAQFPFLLYYFFLLFRIFVVVVVVVVVVAVLNVPVRLHLK